MKIIRLFFASFGFLVCASSLHAQSIAGYWEGVFTQQGAELPVSLRFAREANGLSARFFAPTMRALDVPLRNVTLTETKAHFELAGDSGATLFDGVVEGDRFTGGFTGNEGTGTFTLHRRQPRTPRFGEQEVQLHSGDVTLAGTFLLPKTPGRRPAVIFVHGSGAEGRFGSRYLAEYLAERGIATLIHDKRGVGASTGDWRTASLDDLAADALAGLRFLRQQPSIDPNAIGVYGHSQGGLVASIMATSGANLAFAIACASYGGVVYEQDHYRVEHSLRTTDFTPDEQKAAMTFYRQFIEVARTGRGWEAFDLETRRVRGQRWYEWLEIPPRDNWLWNFYPPVGNFNPLPLWERVRIPVLLMYGERDAIVPVGVSIERIGRALDKAGNHDYTAVILPRAGHAFTITTLSGEPFAWRHVAPGLGDIVSGWVLARTAR